MENVFLLLMLFFVWGSDEMLDVDCSQKPEPSTSQNEVETQNSLDTQENFDYVPITNERYRERHPERFSYLQPTTSKERVKRSRSNGFDVDAEQSVWETGEDLFGVHDSSAEIQEKLKKKQKTDYESENISLQNGKLQDESTENERFVCCICYESKVGRVKFPCGHVVCSPSCFPNGLSIRAYRKRNGAEIFPPCPFCRARLWRSINTFDYFCDAPENRELSSEEIDDAVVTAVLSGNLKALENLSERGANLHQATKLFKKVNLLQIADRKIKLCDDFHALKCHQKCYRYLLQKGAQFNDLETDKVFHREYAPNKLEIACMLEKIKFVKYLLKLDNETILRHGALLQAIKKKNALIFNILLKDRALNFDLYKDDPTEKTIALHLQKYIGRSITCSQVFEAFDEKYDVEDNSSHFVHMAIRLVDDSTLAREINNIIETQIYDSEETGTIYEVEGNASPEYEQNLDDEDDNESVFQSQQTDEDENL